MGSRDAAHRLRRRVVIEKNAAAAVDLQIDETRRKQYSPAAWLPSACQGYSDHAGATRSIKPRCIKTTALSCHR